MSRQIDFSKPLSDDDRAWLEERSLGWKIPQAPGVELDPNASSEDLLEHVPNTGTVNTAAADLERAVAEGHQPEDSYEKWTVAELKEELKTRELAVSGKHDELVDRLEEDDANRE